MSDILDRIRDLRRPRILVRAARFGLPDYDRERDLKRMYGQATPPGPGRALAGLLDREEEFERVRLTGDAGYSAARHIEVLVALMAETRFLAPPPAAS